ncbi:MAG: lipid-A-disaccharide synthase [Candidatus Omnitrophica bacterium]|nr:lipid-A-disaccharide synthase [Candidatus Omnitrophota bacterium]MCM8798549.1 lipid-A-disaccharide synthase [Candidatus Omnitrophota bacterium]
MKEKTIFIVAGESSGDLHGSRLAKAIKKLDPEIKICGTGGSLMQTSGVEIYYNFLELAVVGFWEVLKNLGKFRSIFKLLVKKLEEVKPDLVVLIDYPGFNLRFAKEVKRRNIKLVYYISPQVWAWGRKRIRLIKRLVDKMIVIFKFEEGLYKSYGIDAVFVGHPLLDMVKPSQTKNALLEKYKIDYSKKIISLLPGSREMEIRRHLPILLETAKLISQKIPDVEFTISRAPHLPNGLFSSLLSNFPISVLVLENSYDCIELADFVLVSSGTATLETAILGKPMLIIYKTSFLTWLIIKPQIKIPYVGMVNIVAKEEVVPEFVQYKARPEKISQKVTELLNNPEELKKMKEKLEMVKNRLGTLGAAERAAKIVYEMVL